MTTEDPNAEQNAGQSKLPSEPLPPVAPPTAGFILQLFLIPMIIVMIIVLVWLMFSWVVHMGSDPQGMVDGLKKGNDNSWQNASALADMLRNPQYEHLKDDHELAQKLADALDEQIDAKKYSDTQIRLRIFVCRALGEFRVDDGIPALLRAATTEREPEEIDVRRAAVQSLAVLSSQLGPEKMRKNEEVMDTLIEIANDRRADAEDTENLRAELRSHAAFTLGVIGGDRANDQLAAMLSSSYPNARFNAAAGLSRQGDARAERVLVEMLDPDNEATTADEPSKDGKKAKRILVMSNAAKAAKMLAQNNNDDDLSELKAALEKAIESDPPREVKFRSEEALKEFKLRTP